MTTNYPEGRTYGQQMAVNARAIQVLRTEVRRLQASAGVDPSAPPSDRRALHDEVLRLRAVICN